MRMIFWSIIGDSVKSGFGSRRWRGWNVSVWRLF